MEASYRWADGDSFDNVLNCLGSDDVNDGNFIKNMLKITLK